MRRQPRPVVYFSYRIKGSRNHARRVAQRLEDEGIVEVFSDAEIPPGAHWPSVLQEGLDRSSALIFFIDEDWLHYQDDWGRRRIDNPEDWVHREVSHALRHKKPVLPVLVENARMPPRQALPEPLADIAEIQAPRLRWGVFERDCQPILQWALDLTAGGKRRGRGLGITTPNEPNLQIERLMLSDFRCFEDLELDFTRTSTLEGVWTCLVGLNGAGKSTVLQAISLLFMGPDYARELGGARLQSLRRSDPEGRKRSTLRGWVRHGHEEHYLELILGEAPSGSTSRRIGRSGRDSSVNFWNSADNLPIVGFGAGRNLSDSPDRWLETSDIVRSQISLFDPMARLYGAEGLFETHSPARTLFQKLIGKVFPKEVIQSRNQGEFLEFAVANSVVHPNDLPDGLRSSAAWMASLCARLSVTCPNASDLEELYGLVLIDEIDLHLHASLQRLVVPRLRTALPNVQFIVTSHSPLVITSFDRNELVLLDHSADDGQRALDRQIFAFSSDEIYSWLMETPPHSAALDRKVEEGTDPNLLEILLQDRSTDETRARKRAQRQREILQEMGIVDGTEV